MVGRGTSVGCFDIASKSECVATVPEPCGEGKYGSGMFTQPLQARRGYGRHVVPHDSRSVTRRTGRPRRSGIAFDGDPRAEILSVASRLFSERGVNATTMAEIARRSGLQQSSMYYYFGSKEQILEAVVSEANRAPLELVERIRDEPAPAVVQLYRVVRADVVALCALPYDLNEIHRLAARDAKTFARYWRERSRLERAVTDVIESGIAAGELRTVDAELTAVTILSNDEATQNWMRNDPRRAKKKPAAVGGPFAIGTFLADLTLRGLMQMPRDLDKVRRHADTLDARSVIAK
jgi:AcrR family transcriptional regulator